jgi:hypothetical protein
MTYRYRREQQIAKGSPCLNQLILSSGAFEV